MYSKQIMSCRRGHFWMYATHCIRRTQNEVMIELWMAVNVWPPIYRPCSRQTVWYGRYAVTLHALVTVCNAVRHIQMRLPGVWSVTASRFSIHCADTEHTVKLLLLNSGLANSFYIFVVVILLFHFIIKITFFTIDFSDT